MPVATLPQSPDSPLTSDHRHELAQAQRHIKPIRTAAGVATFNGWVTGVFAALSAPFALFSISGLILTVGLAVVAYNEFRGCRRLLALDPSSATLLGWNQLGFLALIVVYCLWNLFASLDSFAAQLRANPELEASLGSLQEFDALYRIVLVGVYATVIVLSGAFQGLNALYYFTRRKYIAAYLQQTPAWIQELRR